MTMTLYHSNSGTWQRRVLRDVWARWSRGSGRTAGLSRSDGGESFLLIPWREELEIAPGDGVLAGEGPELTPGPLKEQLSTVQIVGEVRLHRPGSPLDHWEVTAR